MKKIIKIILVSIAAAVFTVAFAVTGINIYITVTTSDKIITEEGAKELSADCILVLGCQVRKDGTPSNMLADRLSKGVELYNLGVSEKLLMSGDHGSDDYNEVGAMKQYAIDNGVPSENVFMDHAGFSTYESLYRAKELFGVQKVVIVTQEYHLYRAVYIARSLGIDAVGVSAEKIDYAGQLGREIREILARVKDFIQVFIRPELQLSDEAVFIGGNGDITNKGEAFA